MRTKGTAGFTLIEVMLFLALSGLLFLIAFFGTGSQMREVRFTDSMRSLDSFLQKQYSLVQTGANPRNVASTCTVDFGSSTAPPTFGTGVTGANDTAGDNDNCVLLGRLIKFTPGSTAVTVYPVVGRHLTSAQLTGNDYTDLVNSAPTLGPEANENYTINWGTTFIQPNGYAASSLTQAMAFLRSPSSGRIMGFAFGTDIVNNATTPGSDTTFRTSGLNSTQAAKNSGFCFNSSYGHKGIIKLGYNQRTEALDIAFDGINTTTDCQRNKP